MDHRSEGHHVHGRGRAADLRRGPTPREGVPNNALVVVRRIVLDRSTSPPTVSGGTLFERQPWSISDDALHVISYKYEVPDDLYAPDGGVPAEDLL